MHLWNNLGVQSLLSLKNNNNNTNATINVQHKSKRRRSKLYDKQTTSRTRSERIRRAVPRNHYMPSHSDMFIGNLWFCWAHKLKKKKCPKHFIPNSASCRVLEIFLLHITKILIFPPFPPKYSHKLNSNQLNIVQENNTHI